MNLVNALRAALVLLYLNGSLALAEASSSPCASTPQESFSGEAVATAALIANATNRSGSLRFESRRLLEDALNALEPNPCCSQGSLGEVMLSSVPQKFLTGYSDESTCQTEFKKTKSAPIMYSDRSFSSLDELNSWVGDLSQGKGTDGKDLYRRCPGSCSPQFTYRVQKSAAGALTAHAAVLCGPARDKSDNQYTLRAVTSWACAGSAQ